MLASGVCSRCRFTVDTAGERREDLFSEIRTFVFLCVCVPLKSMLRFMTCDWDNDSSLSNVESRTD
ncbi:hypothetical protein HanRHA438_Chr08g0340451 [Helianthus annuus]|nr:hypothetical protein HanRHA438_Chr08g0340451 [Helianthus annuus]